MTITLNQFDGQYTQADVDAMNAEVQAVLDQHDFAAADLMDSERDQIRRAVENEVSGHYDPNLRGCSGVVELMPAGWARLINSRSPRRSRATP